MKEAFTYLKKQISDKRKLIIYIILIFIAFALVWECKSFFHSTQNEISEQEDNEQIINHQTENNHSPHGLDSDLLLDSSNIPEQQIVISIEDLREEFKKNFYTSEQLQEDTNIRILLSNPQGGYYFDLLYIENINCTLLSIKDETSTEEILYENTQLILNKTSKTTFEYSIKNTEGVLHTETIVRNTNYDENSHIDQHYIQDQLVLQLLQEGDNRPIIMINEKDGGKYYEGELEIYCNQNGFFIVNILPIEEYLKYVVPGEMLSTYPEQALKAQAICARTYAYKSIEEPHFPTYLANIDDTTQTQVYHTQGMQETTNQAVVETKGLCLFDVSGLADVYYYSTSWGQSGDLDLWKTEELQRNLQVSEKTFTENEFKDMIGKIASGDLERKEAFYRWTYSVNNPEWDSVNDVLSTFYSKDQVVVFDPEGKLTTNIDFKQKQLIEDIQVLERGSGGGVNRLMLKTNLYSYLILGEYSIRSVMFALQGTCINNNNQKIDYLSILPSSYFYIDPCYQNQKLQSFTLYGGGLGHGIGMSQNGAKNLASIGKKYLEILNTYYPKYQVDSIQIALK